MTEKINLPSVVGSTIMPHMSARARTAIMDEIFQKTGGVDKAVEWANSSPENYGKFLSLWAKGQMKQIPDANPNAATVEDMIARFDAGAHAKVISPDEPE